MARLASGKSYSQQSIRIIFFAFPILIWLIYLFAFWPGLMSVDSFTQWDQVAKGIYGDWHPILSTVLIWIITRLWYSPAAVVIVQILYFSVGVSYCLSFFMEHGVNKILLIVMCMLFSLWPLNGLLVITVWKDIPYSISILIFSVMLLNIYFSKGEWLEKNLNVILFTFVIVIIALFRHNGFLVGFGTVFLMVLFSKRMRKIASLVLITAILIWQGSQIILLHTLNVDPNNKLGWGFLLIHPIAAHIHSGAQLTSEETDYLNQIYPLEKGWDYSCYDATVLFYKGVSFKPTLEDPFQALRIFLRLTFENPKITFDHFLCLSSFTWRLTQPPNVYLETVILSSTNLQYYPRFQYLAPIISEGSKLPKIQDFIKYIYKKLTNNPGDLIFWRPAIYLYLYLLAVIVLVIKNRSINIFLIAIPALLQIFGMTFIINLEAVRYQYPIYVISALMTIPLMLLEIKSPAEEYTENLLKKQGILVLSGVKGDTRRYRNHHIYEQLKLADVPVALAHITDAGLISKIKNARAVILHRAPYDSMIARIVEITHRENILLVYDLDDLIFDEQALNWIHAPEFQASIRRNVFKEDLLLHKQTLDQCEVALASTDFLARLLIDQKKKACVHRNAFSLEMLAHSKQAFREVLHDPNRVIIGYASGSPTHNKDFGVARPALMRILQKYPHVELHLIGPLDPGDDWGQLSNQIHHHSMVPWRQLPYVLATYDINLAPLVANNPFGQSKSEIKWMEAALVRVPTVASPTDAFKFAIKDGENGFLAYSEDEWFVKLSRLVEDRAERLGVGKRAYQDVIERYHPAVRAVQLVDTLNEIHREKLGTTLVEKPLLISEVMSRVNQISWLSPEIEKHPTLTEMAWYNLRQHGVSSLIRRVLAYTRRKLASVFPYKAPRDS